MASYTTVENLIKVVPHIGSISNISSSNMVYAIERVEAIINSKLAGTYTVPLTGTIPILEYVATDLAVYELVGKRSLTATKDTENDWPSRFKKSYSMLDDIVNGDLVLYTSSGDLVTKRSGSLPWSNNYGYTPTFNEDSFEESSTDLDKQLDIFNDRD